MQKLDRVPNDVDAVREEAALVPATTVSDRAKYLTEIAGGMAGRPIKFDIKASKFITTDDGSEVADAEYIALCPETLTGFIKFNGPDTPPDREMGLSTAATSCRRGKTWATLTKRSGRRASTGRRPTRGSIRSRCR